jgi:hypothetical protein
MSSHALAPRTPLRKRTNMIDAALRPLLSGSAPERTRCGGTDTQAKENEA